MIKYVPSCYLSLKYRDMILKHPLCISTNYELFNFLTASMAAQRPYCFLPVNLMSQSICTCPSSNLAIFINDYNTYGIMVARI